jgi:hypothetical protein
MEIRSGAIKTGPKIGEMWSVGSYNNLIFRGIGRNFEAEKLFIFDDDVDGLFVISKDEFYQKGLSTKCNTHLIQGKIIVKLANDFCMTWITQRPTICGIASEGVKKYPDAIEIYVILGEDYQIKFTRNKDEPLYWNSIYWNNEECNWEKKEDFAYKLV